MTLLEKRDAILSSLRAQFRCRVDEITVHDRVYKTHITYAIAGDGIPAGLDALLLDIANNIAQGLADETDDDDHVGMTSW